MTWHVEEWARSISRWIRIHGDGEEDGAVERYESHRDAAKSRGDGAVRLVGPQGVMATYDAARGGAR